MIHRVATAYARPFMDVAREPFALTLFCFLLVTEHERISGLIAEFRDVNVAGLNAAAWHEPKRLKDALRETQRKAGMLESVDEARARARELLADVAMLDAKGEGGL